MSEEAEEEEEKDDEEKDVAVSDPEEEGGEQLDAKESVADESDAAEEDVVEEDSAEEDREEEDMEQEENKEDLEQVKVPPKHDMCRSTRLRMQSANPSSSYEPPARTQKQPGGNASRSRPSRTRANLLEVVIVLIDWSV